MQIAKPCFHEPNGCTCVMSQHHFGKSRQWSLSLSLCLNFPTFAKHRLSRVRPQFVESEERLWRWTTDQCSEVSSSSLARSVVKCDITAQYSAVQHSTAQYRGPEQESKPSEEGGHQLRPYLPAPTTPHSAPTNSSSLSHQLRFSLLKHTPRQRLGVQRAVRMII